MVRSATITPTTLNAATHCLSNLSKPSSDTLSDFVRRTRGLSSSVAEPGTSVWSAGHGVNSVARRRPRSAGLERSAARTRCAPSKFPAPVIAMIGGAACGAGACELVFACDLVIAAPSRDVCRDAQPSLACPITSPGC